MMANLFSVFDPSTNIFNISFNWLSTTLMFFIVPYLFWLTPNRFSLIWNKIFTSLHLEFKTLLKSNKMIGSTFIFITLFIFVMCNNIMGLFSYIFTSTSHLTLTLLLALPLWLSFMFYGWLNNTQHMFFHMIPQGTPNALMPFMVLIETISNIIRPGTLAIRLSANMIAGHLLMVLLGNTGPGFPTYLLFILILIQILLLILEISVSVIQAYVISILSTLYSSEVI